MSVHSLKAKILNHVGNTGWIAGLAYLLSTPIESGTIIPIQLVVGATVFMIAGYGTISRRIGKINNPKIYSIATTVQSVIPFALTAFLLREAAVHLDEIMQYLVVLGGIVGGAHTFKIVAAFIDEVPESLSGDEITRLKTQLPNILGEAKSDTTLLKGGEKDGRKRKKAKSAARRIKVIRPAFGTSDTKDSV